MGVRERKTVTMEVKRKTWKRDGREAKENGEGKKSSQQEDKERKGENRVYEDGRGRKGEMQSR